MLDTPEQVISAFTRISHQVNIMQKILLEVEMEHNNFFENITFKPALVALNLSSGVPKFVEASEAVLGVTGSKGAFEESSMILSL